jgi:hypothetical protein
VIEQSETRRELEKHVRALVPKRAQVGNSIASSRPGVAALGVGSVMTGYVWGWVRGRRGRKRKKKVS